MHHERYTPEKAGELLPIERNLFAFNPAPLPPQLPPSWGLSQFISSADRTLCELAGAARNLPNPHLIIRPFITREAVLSSQIEQIQASISDLALYKASKEEKHSHVREVYNYVLALENGLELLKKFPVCLRVIREVHGHLLQGVRGKDKQPGSFRKIQNFIGTPGSTMEQARYIPPPPAEMEQGMNQLERYINTPADEHEYPPLVRLALVHYQFESLHPFIDGNGRVGRLLITLMLCAGHLLPAPLLYLSAYFEKNRTAYYDLLLAVSQEGKWEDWIRYFLVGVAEQAKDAMRRSNRLVDLWKYYRDQLQGVARASNLPLKLVDELFSSPMVTAKKAAELLGVTQRSAQLNIDRLIRIGALKEATGKQRNRVYVAPEILRVIEEDEDESEATEKPKAQRRIELETADAAQ